LPVREKKRRTSPRAGEEETSELILSREKSIAGDTMRLLEDKESFEKLQKLLAQSIAETIKSGLEDRMLTPDLVKDLTANLAFSIVCILDASTVTTVEGGNLKPIITFQTNDDTLVWANGTSNMHDYIYGWVYDLF
jgi:hypothetical protein